MPKTKLDRVKVKTLDSQFEYILKELFEYSPREAKAIVEAANEVYQLNHYDPSYHVSEDKIVRTVISKKANHGPVLESLPKVQVTLTESITKEDKKLFRTENKSALRRVKILRMAEESWNRVAF